jgi:cytochrome c peroxidase
VLQVIGLGESLKVSTGRAAATTQALFDGPLADEDLGREDVTGDPAKRYRFRTPSLRGVAIEAACMHDGAFTTPSDAIRHHLNAQASLLVYDPAQRRVAPDLAGPVGPRAALLIALDPRLATPLVLAPTEIDDLVAFVRDGLLDPRARAERLRHLVPNVVPSGNATLFFQCDPMNRREGGLYCHDPSRE